MNNKLSLFWFTRAFTILFICFLTLFSFDVFEPDSSIQQVLIAFFIHNIPSIVLTITLIFSWNRPLVAAIVFFVAADIYIFMTLANIFEIFTALIMILTIAGPSIFISVLFLSEWMMKKKIE